MVFVRPACVLSVFFGLVGCKNNTIELEFDDDSGGIATAVGESGSDDIGDETTDGRMTTTTTPTTATVATTADTGDLPATGWWLFALDPSLSPGLPFQFVVEASEPEPGLWTLTFQSLSLDIGSTTSPRQPVGDVHVYSGIPLGAGAPFQMYTGPITIPGAANPITGSDVSIDAYFDGAELGDPYCGAVSGQVTAPVAADLAGSTFATTRIPDPATLPTEFARACP